MRRYMVAVSALASCASPTMLGAFTDGVGPALGSTHVTVVTAGAGSSLLGPGLGSGIVVEPALSQRTALALGGGAYLPVNDDDGIVAPFWSVQVRRRLERALDGPTHALLIAGVGGQSYIPAGVHVALLGARDHGRWRLYGGGGVQVSWFFTIGAYGLGTAGVTYNPSPSRLSVGLETTVMLGVDSGENPYGDTYESRLPVVGVASLYLRTRVGRGAQERP